MNPIPEFTPSLSDENDPLYLRLESEFVQWANTMTIDGPCEVVLSVGPFDRVPHKWAVRPFSTYEQETMKPCVRLRVECTDFWRENVEESAFDVALPPENDDSLSWTDGFLTVLQAMPYVFAEAQVNYLGRLFRSHGFDQEQFLADTEGMIGQKAQMHYLEARAYACLLDDLIDGDEVPPAHRKIAVAVRDALLEHLNDLWKETADRAAAIAAAEAEAEAKAKAAVQAAADNDGEVK